jgi:hypothetical protein
LVLVGRVPCVQVGDGSRRLAEDLLKVQGFVDIRKWQGPLYVPAAVVGRHILAEHRTGEHQHCDESCQ